MSAATTTSPRPASAGPPGYRSCTPATWSTGPPSGTRRTVSNPPPTSRLPATTAGPHQGGWVRTSADEDWFLHFQARGAYGRVVHLQPMRWDPEGRPVIGDEGEPVPRRTVAVHSQPATRLDQPAQRGRAAPHLRTDRVRARPAAAARRPGAAAARGGVHRRGGPRAGQRRTGCQGRARRGGGSLQLDRPHGRRGRRPPDRPPLRRGRRRTNGRGGVPFVPRGAGPAARRGHGGSHPAASPPTPATGSCRARSSPPPPGAGSEPSSASSPPHRPGRPASPRSASQDPPPANVHT